MSSAASRVHTVKPMIATVARFTSPNLVLLRCPGGRGSRSANISQLKPYYSEDVENVAAEKGDYPGWTSRVDGQTVIVKLYCIDTQCYYVRILSRGFTAPLGR